MSNAKIKYINASGNIITYTFGVNYKYKFREKPEIDRRIKRTINGIISKEDIKVAQTFDMDFSLLQEAQKEEFEAIESCGIVYFYPEGGTTPVYYGLIAFSKFNKEYSYYVCSMHFEESTELTSEFSFITAKVVNNDSEIYEDYDWEIAGINTAWLIANKGLAADCHNLKIRDRTGAFYDYYVVPETWNSSNTIFWIKKGNVDYYEIFFLQFVINDNYNYTQDPDLIFDYDEDFESYAVGSNIHGQGGWSCSGGNPATIQNDADGNYLYMNALNNKQSVYRTLPVLGVGNVALYKFKAQVSGGTGSYKIGWGDVINAGTYDIENGYYTTNTIVAAAPTTGRVLLYKMVAMAQTKLVEDDIVQDASKYFWSYFFWDGNTKKSGFRDVEVSAIDTTFTSEDKFFLGIYDASGMRNYCRIQQILIGKTARTKPTVTIYGQP